MVERLKMELSVEKLLNSIWLLLNGLHEIWVHGTFTIDLKWGQGFILFLAEKGEPQLCATLQKEECLIHLEE